MPLRLSRLARPVLALLTFAAAFRPGPAGGAERASTIHWKTSVTREGARPGQFLQQAEIWLSDGRFRIEDRTPGMPPTDLLVLDETVYLWEIGKTTGLKMPAGLARRTGRPWHDYARRRGEVREAGKLLRSETREGHACDVFAFEDPPETQGTYWLAKDLDDFPIRIEIERPEAVLPFRSRPTGTVRIVYENREVRPGEKTEAARFVAPPGMTFDDASEILTGHPRAAPH